MKSKGIVRWLFVAVVIVGSSGCYPPGPCTTCCPSFYAPPPAPPPPVAAAQPVRKRITLRGVNFDFDKWNIRPDARVILDEAARILNEELSEASVVVEGHTDWMGSDEYNERLALRRADSVRSYLIARGVAPSRLRIAGFGERQPVASNETEDGRAQNRRVELRIEGQG